MSAPDPTPTPTSPTSDPITSLLTTPVVTRIEQYLVSGVTALTFLAGVVHPGFTVPTVTSTTIGSVSVAVFGAINGWAWLQNRLHKKVIAAMATATAHPRWGVTPWIAPALSVRRQLATSSRPVGVVDPTV